MELLTEEKKKEDSAPDHIPAALLGIPSAQPGPTLAPSLQTKYVPPALSGIPSADQRTNPPNQLKQSYMDALEMDPKRVNEVLKFADKTNSSPLYVDNNLDKFRKYAHAPDEKFWDEYIKNYPISSSFLAQKENMARFRDSLENLAKTESFFSSGKRALKSAEAALRLGLNSRESAKIGYEKFLGYSNPRQDELLQAIQRQNEELSGLRPTFDWEASYPELGATLLKKAAFGAIEFMPTLAGMTEEGAKAALSIAPAILAASSAGPLPALLMTKAAMSAGVAKDFYEQSTGSAYLSLSEVRDKDGKPLPDDIKKPAAALVGLANAGLPFATGALKFIPGANKVAAMIAAETGVKALTDSNFKQAVTKWFGDVTKASAHGGAFMGATHVVGAIGESRAKYAAELLHGQQHTYPTWIDFGLQTAEAFGEGALTFGTMHAAPGAARVVLGGAREFRYQLAKGTAEKFREFAQEQKASLLRASDPAKYAEFLSEAAKGSGFETPRIPVQDFQIFFQERGLDPAGEAEKLGVSEEYKEAIRTNGDVVIPIERLAVEYGDTVLGEMYKDIKFDPDADTLRQQERFAEEAAKEREAFRKVIEEEAKLADPLLEKDVKYKEAHDSIVKEMKELLKGNLIIEKMKPAEQKKVINDSAKLWAGFTIAQADGRGISPEEMFARIKPRLIGEEEAADILGKQDEGVLEQRRGDLFPAAAFMSFGALTSPAAHEAVEYMRFSGQTDVIAAHNLSEEHLISALNVGGIPNPSLALTKAQMGHVNFGEITLIANKNLADPTRVPVYNRDAYTPIYPFVTEENGRKVFVDNKGKTVEASLENISKAMSEIETERANKRITDWAELSEKKKNIVPPAIGDAYVSNVPSKVNAEALHLYLTAVKGEKNRELVLDHIRNASQIILDSSSSKKGVSEARGYLAKNGIELNDSEMRWMVSAAEGIASEHTPFFESKPNRVVKMNEFAGAVIPKGSSKELREALTAAGIPYREYGGKSQRIKVTEQFAKELNQQRGDVLFQGRAGVTQGFAIPKERIIHLGKAQDASTFMHESSHIFLDDIFTHITSGEASEKYLTDFAPIKDFLGITDDQKALTEAQQEKFADAFEVYLKDGTAPTKALKTVFSHFGEWLKNLFKWRPELKDVQLNTEIRNAIDKLIATDDQINFATEEAGFFKTVDTSILPESLRDRVEALLDSAKASSKSTWLKMTSDERKQKVRRAVTPKVEQTINELPVYQATQDLQNRMTEKADIKALSTKYPELMNGPIDEIRTEQEMAFISAIAEVAEARDTTPEALAAEISKSPTREEAIKGEVDALVEQATNPEAAAQIAVHNFSRLEAMELNRAVMEALTLHKDWVKALDKHEAKTEAQLKADQDRAHEAYLKAQKAAKKKETKQTKEQIKKLEDDWLRAKDRHDSAKARRHEMAKLSEMAKIRARIATEEAEKAILNKSIRDAGSYLVYFRQEKKAAFQLGKAIQAQDWEKAGLHQREMIANHALGMAAHNAARKIESATNRLNRFANRGRSLLKMPKGYVAQIDNVLRQFDLSNRPEDDLPDAMRVAVKMFDRGEDAEQIADATGLVLMDTNGVKSWQPETREMFLDRLSQSEIDIDVPDSIRTTDNKRFTDLTFGELLDIRDFVNAINRLGKSAEGFLSDPSLGSMNDARNVTAKFIHGLLGNRRGYEAGLGEPIGHGTTDKILNAINDLPSDFVRDYTHALTISKILSNDQVDSPMMKYFYNPIKRAGDLKLERADRVKVQVKEIFDRHYPKKEFAELRKRIHEFKSTGFQFSHDKLIALGLNQGNAENKQRVLGGYKQKVPVFDERGKPVIDELNRQVFRDITQAEVDEMLDRLEEKDWKLIQDVIDYLDSFWPEIKELEMDAAGMEPEKVEATPIHTKFGTFKGGYYPIDYDMSMSFKSFKDGKEDTGATYKQKSSAARMTKRGHLKARVERANHPLSLDLNLIFDHLDDVVHDLYYRRVLMDANRFVRHPDIKRAIVEAKGIKTHRTLTQWLEDLAQNNLVPLPAEGLALKAKNAATWTFVGYQFKTFFKVAGENLMNYVKDVGPSKFFQHFVRFNGRPLENREWVRSKSIRMRARDEHLTPDISQIHKEMKGEENFLEKWAFFAHNRADWLFSYPLWAFEYNRNIHLGEESAIHAADNSVTHAFGSGMEVDLPAVFRRGSPFWRMSVAWQQVQVQQLNRMLVDSNKAKIEFAKAGINSKAKAAFILAESFAYTWLLRGLMIGLVREGFRDDEEKGDAAKRIGLEMATHGFELLPPYGKYLKGAVEEAMGEHAKFSSPIDEVAMTVLRPAIDLGKALAKDKPLDEVDPHLKESLALPFNLYFHVPKQFNDIIFNFIDYLNGEGEFGPRELMVRHHQKKSRHHKSEY